MEAELEFLRNLREDLERELDSLRYQLDLKTPAQPVAEPASKLVSPPGSEPGGAEPAVADVDTTESKEAGSCQSKCEPGNSNCCCTCCSSCSCSYWPRSQTDSRVVIENRAYSDDHPQAHTQDQASAPTDAAHPTSTNPNRPERVSSAPSTRPLLRIRPPPRTLSRATSDLVTYVRDAKTALRLPSSPGEDEFFSTKLPELRRRMGSMLSPLHSPLGGLKGVQLDGGEKVESASTAPFPSSYSALVRSYTGPSSPTTNGSSGPSLLTTSSSKGGTLEDSSATSILLSHTSGEEKFRGVAKEGKAAAMAAAAVREDLELLVRAVEAKARAAMRKNVAGLVPPAPRRLVKDGSGGSNAGGGGSAALAIAGSPSPSVASTPPVSRTPSGAEAPSVIGMHNHTLAIYRTASAATDISTDGNTPVAAAVTIARTSSVPTETSTAGNTPVARAVGGSSATAQMGMANALTIYRTPSMAELSTAGNTPVAHAVTMAFASGLNASGLLGIASARLAAAAAAAPGTSSTTGNTPAASTAAGDLVVHHHVDTLARPLTPASSNAFELARESPSVLAVVSREERAQARTQEQLVGKLGYEGRERQRREPTALEPVRHDPWRDQSLEGYYQPLVSRPFAAARPMTAQPSGRQHRHISGAISSISSSGRGDSRSTRMGVGTEPASEASQREPAFEAPQKQYGQQTERWGLWTSRASGAERHTSFRRNGAAGREATAAAGGRVRPVSGSQMRGSGEGPGSGEGVEGRSKQDGRMEIEEEDSTIENAPLLQLSHRNRQQQQGANQKAAPAAAPSSSSASPGLFASLLPNEERRRREEREQGREKKERAAGEQRGAARERMEGGKSPEKPAGEQRGAAGGGNDGGEIWEKAAGSREVLLLVKGLKEARVVKSLLQGS
ncbi:hypothetical protein CLOM_g24101 [Closterium sp. NIES-68]|nr:hypothetical protein CLOM_g24101 [Closterium sp. NIES-68]